MFETFLCDLFYFKNFSEKNNKGKDSFSTCKMYNTSVLPLELLLGNDTSLKSNEDNVKMGKCFLDLNLLF